MNVRQFLIIQVVVHFGQIKNNAMFMYFVQSEFLNLISVVFFVVLFFIGDNRISMSYSTRMIMQVFWLDISLFKEKIDLVIQSAVCLEARGEAAVYIPY